MGQNNYGEGTYEWHPDPSKQLGYAQVFKPPSFFLVPLQSNVLNVLGGMTKLTAMKLIVNCAGEGEYCKVAYDGEFVPVPGKKKLFNKLTQLELYLTEPWVRAHMGGDDGADSEGGSSSAACGSAEGWSSMRRAFYGARRDQPDPCLSDLLRHRGDVVTHLDMVPVGPGQSESPFAEQIAALPKLRSIALRAEMLGVTR